MIYLKEYGSLDVERINQLPIDEYVEVMGTLTQEQYKEYEEHISKQPINESREGTKPIIVECTMEEDVERNGLVDVDEYLNIKRKKYGLK